MNINRVLFLSICLFQVESPNAEFPLHPTSGEPQVKKEDIIAVTFHFKKLNTAFVILGGAALVCV